MAMTMTPTHDHSPTHSYDPTYSHGPTYGHSPIYGYSGCIAPHRYRCRISYVQPGYIPPRGFYINRLILEIKTY